MIPNYKQSCIKVEIKQTYDTCAIFPNNICIFCKNQLSIIGARFIMIDCSTCNYTMSLISSNFQLKYYFNIIRYNKYSVIIKNGEFCIGLNNSGKFHHFKGQDTKSIDLQTLFNNINILYMIEYNR